MPRGRLKQILHTASFRSSPGTRMCHADHKGHKIKKGKIYLSIKDGLNEKSYCLFCAKLILENGKKQLESLLDNLNKAMSDL